MDTDVIDTDLMPKRRMPWQMRFESERVEMILEVFKLIDRKKHDKHNLYDLLDDCEREHGERTSRSRACTGYFRRSPCSWPLATVPGVAEHCSPAKLFRHFDEVFLSESYLEVYDCLLPEAQGRPIGMVVPFDGYRGGIVVHNGVFDTRSTKMISPVLRDDPPHLLTVEPFKHLIQYLARGGFAEGALARGKRDATAAGAAGDDLHPLAHAGDFGPGATLVLCLVPQGTLLTLGVRSALRPPRQERRALRDRAGKRTLGTGLSLRQVQRGLAKLCEEKLHPAENVGDDDCVSGLSRKLWPARTPKNRTVPRLAHQPDVRPAGGRCHQEGAAALRPAVAGQRWPAAKNDRTPCLWPIPSALLGPARRPVMENTT